MEETKGWKSTQTPGAESPDSNFNADMTMQKKGTIYKSFPVIPESETEGWVYGAITEHKSEDGMTYGDGYVIAPDGTEAGIVWDLTSQDFSEIHPPIEVRWGVYGVRFDRPVKSVDDIVHNFRLVLPKLKEQYAKLKGGKI